MKCLTVKMLKNVLTFRHMHSSTGCIHPSTGCTVTCSSAGRALGFHHCVLGSIPCVNMSDGCGHQVRPGWFLPGSLTHIQVFSTSTDHTFRQTMEHTDNAPIQAMHTYIQYFPEYTLEDKQNNQAIKMTNNKNVQIPHYEVRKRCKQGFNEQFHYLAKQHASSFLLASTTWDWPI